MTDRNRTQAALELFDLARHEQRIHVLELLGEVSFPVTCRQLAEQVHEASEAATPPADLAQALHHFHLPAMDDAGILTYDGQARHVTEFDAERLRTLVEATDDMLGHLSEE